MDFINLLGSAWPEGNFWASLIKLFDVGSYAWTIIIFTIVLKLVLSPIDFLQRYFTNKTSRAQAKLQPELEKLKKRYGQNQTLLYQKQNELYQKSGVGMKGSCIVMLVYMVVTFSVFLTLFSSLQSISGFKINNQYNELSATYHNSYNTEYLQDYLGIDLSNYATLSDEEKTNLITEKEAEKSEEDVAAKKAETQRNAQIKVVNHYKEIKDSWLWIRNVWKADKATTKEISTYADFKSATGNNSVTESEYNTVMKLLLEDYENSNQVNGYYLLSVIVVAVSFFSQWLTKRISQPKSKTGERAKVQQPGFAKILMFLLPFVMLLFTLRSSACFAIYIITNSVMSTLITPITTVISNKIEDKKEKQRQDAIKVDYRR